MPMKSATRELLLFFQRHGVQFISDPYISLTEDAANLAPVVESRGPLCRITNGRWFVQWWGRMTEDLSWEIVMLLEYVVAHNRAAVADAARAL